MLHFKVPLGGFDQERFAAAWLLLMVLLRHEPEQSRTEIERE
jgi:hypothetical protein